MKLVLSGYYGFGNLGDEALLAAAVAGLRRRLPGARLVVLSGDPARTAAEHGVEAVPRHHPLQVARALRGARLLLSGGGSLLQDVTGPFSLPYYLAVIELALRLGVPVVIFAQGIGPLRGAVSRALAGRALRRVRAIAVRDPDSLAVLAELGVRGVPVEVTADLALTLDPPPARAQAGGGGAPYLVVNVRRRELDGSAARTLGRALARVAREAGCGLVFVPMHAAEDVPAARAVASHAQDARVPVQLLERRLGLSEALALIAGAEAVLAMRLHALIFAALAGRLPLGLSYDPKVDAFLRRIGLSAVAPMRGLPPEPVLAERVRGALAEREALVQRVRSALPELRRAAERNFDLVESLLR